MPIHHWLHGGAAAVSNFEGTFTDMPFAKHFLGWQMHFQE